MDFGYLIVEKYESLYEKYKSRYKSNRNWYAIPRIDKTANYNQIRYRGIDRDCIKPYKDSKRNLAEIRLDELNIYKEYEDEDFIPEEYLKEIYEWLGKDREYFEIIFVRKYDCNCDIPQKYKSIGFEASYFISDHFSTSCDCMLFPRWHGTDQEGAIFKEYFGKLNMYGLFSTSLEAKKFLDYYLSFDWTETGEYFITEVFIEKI